MNDFYFRFFSLFFYLFSSNAIADQWKLPRPDEISHITIESEGKNNISYYTAESLLASLPNMQRANIGKSLGFGKVWLWQMGTIHLRNGNEILWRAFTDNIILVETNGGPVFYTDIQSQTNDFSEGKIIRVVRTEAGLKKIEIDIIDIK